MHRLIHFELQKILCKRNVIFSVCILLILNFFLLWYTNLSDENTSELSAHKKFQNQISSMSESEKAEYITDLKETIDGIAFVQEISSMQNMDNEMGFMMNKSKWQVMIHIFNLFRKVKISSVLFLYLKAIKRIHFPHAISTRALQIILL